MQAQISTASEPFCLPNSTHKVFINLWNGFLPLSKGAAHWVHFPRLITSESHLPDQSSIVSFEPRIDNAITREYRLNMSDSGIH